MSTALNVLAFVGDRARNVLEVREPGASLLGVPLTEELRIGILGFAWRARGVANGGGGIDSSRDVGRELCPKPEAGLDRDTIGLSGEKKLDWRRVLAGEGGIEARLSIVRSDKDGREVLLNVGVTGVSAGEVVAVE